MGVNIEDEELVKMFNSALKMRETILFILIVVINGLIWIELDIGLDTCTRGDEGWRVWISLKRAITAPQSSSSPSFTPLSWKQLQSLHGCYKFSDGFGSMEIVLLGLLIM